jgi:hypothetical protein
MKRIRKTAVPVSVSWDKSRVWSRARSWTWSWFRSDSWSKSFAWNWAWSWAIESSRINQ